MFSGKRRNYRARGEMSLNSVM